MITAANALGYVANWLTGWVAFDRAALDALGPIQDPEVAKELYAAATFWNQWLTNRTIFIANRGVVCTTR